MAKAKIGIVGAGWWATMAHVPAIQKHPDAEVVSVQKRKREAAQKVADDFGVPHACTTIEEMLAETDMNGVIISSTANMHYAQTMAALEKGVHVLIEKPMTIELGHAREMVELAERKGLHLLVSCPWHYTRHGQDARRLIADGRLGQVKMISILMTNFCEGLYEGKTWDEIFGGDQSTRENMDKPYLEPGRASYSDPSVAGGGHIYCQVSHVAAYIGFLTGQPPVEMFALMDNAQASVDVYDAMCLKLADGTLVTIATNGAPMPTERNYEIRIFGTKGMLFLELWKGKMSLFDRERNIQHFDDVAEADIYPMSAPAENFADLCAGKGENLSPGSLGLYAMQIIDGALRSASEAHNVPIES